MDPVLYALVLTALAGLSTGAGAAIAYFIREPKMSYLAFSLGLSTGVMVYVSFVELLASSMETVGEATAVGAFFAGILLIGVIDALVPETENPHKYRSPGETEGEPPEPGEEESILAQSLRRTGMLAALAIAIHNLPEGMATFGTALSDPELGLLIAGAVAIHNVPEGISVSVPLFYATGDRKKAFLYSTLSGLSEPVGALVAYLVLMPFLTPTVLSGMLAFVGGIMVFISLDELLPMAHGYGRSHIVISGVVMGMVVMALSLLYI